MEPFPYNIIDLTHTLDKDTPTWDGGCGFQHEMILDYEEDDSEVKFRVQKIKARAGIGTHIDAPSHCVPGGQTIESIPLEDLITPIVKIDISSKATEEYKLSVQDILDFEIQYGEIKANRFVIIHTGWSQYWSTPKYRNDLQFPTVSAEAAELLLSRNINGLGIDTLSPDLRFSGFPVHKILLGAGKYIVENIANSHKLPALGGYAITMPMKIDGVTEAPVRMAGLIKKDTEYDQE